MKAVCERHGALFILDEVMSGMGRTGTLHAWEQEDVVPDLQTVAKGLGAGYAPIGALLVNKRVIEALEKGTGGFVHSQTYQGHPIACAAALEVQNIVREENLLANVKEMGAYLHSALKQRMSDHKHVGDIRGRGLFWGVSPTFQFIVGDTLLIHHRSSLSRTRKPKRHFQPNRKSHQACMRWHSKTIPYH